MLNLITVNQEERQELVLTLDEIAREGARKMLIEALRVEAETKAHAAAAAIMEEFRRNPDGL